MVPVFERVHLVSMHHNRVRHDAKAFALFIDDLVKYDSFCEDFGPVNLGCTFRFCKTLREILVSDINLDVMVVSSQENRSLTNCVFLLGAYMIMILDLSAGVVYGRFESLHKNLKTFRDVSPGAQNFHLHLQDCWQGLWRAKQLAWIDFSEGGFELSDYEHCDNPLNADLHEIVPGKLIAMRGPQTIRGNTGYINLPGGSRAFSPAHYADILSQFDAQVVVRLNEPCYDAAEFEREGLAVADLPFDDCARPPPAVVAKFLAIAEAVRARWRCTARRGWGGRGR